MLDHSEKMFRAVFENSPVGLVIVNNDTTLRDVNNYMFKTFCLVPQSIEGEKFGNVFNCSVVSGSEEGCGESEKCKDCRLRGGVTMVLNEGTTIPDTVLDHNFIIAGNDTKKWFKISATRIEEEKDVFAIITFVDITMQKEYEELLNSQLELDMATGIMNKHALLNMLKNLTDGKEDLSVAMIDFDNFKTINDTYGHVAGDRVLKLFCEAALLSTRKQDIVGRFGGEEFMLVFPGTSTELLIKVILRMYDSFREMCSKEMDLTPTFSVGITAISAQKLTEMNVNSIIAEADKNLYLSKSRGKNLITTDGVSISFSRKNSHNSF